MRPEGNGGQAQAWMLLVYTLPREPSAPRVALWRRLKKLGAVLMHDAVWTLPATPATREQLRWLAQEVREAGGEAQVWVAHGELPEQDAQLVAHFVERAERAYQEIMRVLDDPSRSPAELARRFRQVRAMDYFHAPSGDVVRAQLVRLDSGEAGVAGEVRGGHAGPEGGSRPAEHTEGGTQ